MTRELKFDKPLTFGDPDQIAIIKQAEFDEEYEKLPVCDFCDGEGCCDKCQSDCNRCDGIGKDFEAYAEFKANHPLYRLK